jgi:ribose 5-phosphate isomerase B
MNIAIGSDHAGYDQKREMVSHLRGKGYEVTDLGAHGPQPCDYPPIARAVSESVVGGRAHLGVLLCGTGIGMSIAANKVPGIRAALCVTDQQAHDTRPHNDSNVLVLAARVNPLETNLRLMDIWLSAGFTGEERHARRVAQIVRIEQDYRKA